MLAAVLVATGLGKLLDLHGFTDIVASYGVLPDALSFAAGTTLSVTELGLAVWLLSGWRLAWAASLAALLHLAFLAWTALALARGLNIPNCDCFGVFLARPLTPLTLVEDGILFAVALAIVLGTRPGVRRLP